MELNTYSEKHQYYYNTNDVNYIRRTNFQSVFNIKF